MGYIRSEIKNLHDLAMACKIHEDTSCWEFLKVDGTPQSPSTVPTYKREQIGNVALRLAGTPLQDGYYIVRRKTCIEYCCNPMHLHGKPKDSNELKGRPSNNPKGNPAVLKPNGGRKPGQHRPYQSARMIGNSLAVGRGSRERSS